MRFRGDTLKDLEAGKGVGCRTILVQTGQGQETLKKIFPRDNPAAASGLLGSIPLHRPDHPTDSFQSCLSALKKIGRSK